MAVLTKSGRTALADAIRQQPLHLAWGTGNTDWNTSKQEEVTFALNEQAQLTDEYVSEVVVKTSDEATTYTINTDYTVDGVTGIIYRVVTGNIPSEGTILVMYQKDTPPAQVTQDQLINEVGRRLVDEVEFAVEDENGAIVAPTGRFSVSAEPTNHLFVRTRFDFADAASEIIREQALFMGTEVDAALPVGQRYFSGAEVTDPGTLLLVQNSPPLVRQPTSRETYEFVVSF